MPSREKSTTGGITMLKGSGLGPMAGNFNSRSPCPLITVARDRNRSVVGFSKRALNFKGLRAEECKSSTCYGSARGVRSTRAFQKCMRLMVFLMESHSKESRAAMQPHRTQSICVPRVAPWCARCSPRQTANQRRLIVPRLFSTANQCQGGRRKRRDARTNSERKAREILTH